MILLLIDLIAILLIDLIALLSKIISLCSKPHSRNSSAMGTESGKPCELRKIVIKQGFANLQRLCSEKKYTINFAKIKQKTIQIEHTSCGLSYCAMSAETIRINLKVSSQIVQRFWAFQFYNALKRLSILLSAQKLST